MVCKIKQHTTAEPIKDENGYAIGGIYEGVNTSRNKKLGNSSEKEVFRF
jgi:hypothetical protein